MRPESESSEIVVAFGPFRLHPERHLLLKGTDLVPIGSRALDLLIALCDRAGELVTKDQLIALAWPHSIVEESSLRAQIAGLRKVLQSDRHEADYIVAVPGRGYRFVAATSRHPVDAVANTGADSIRTAPLPVRLASVIGRDAAINVLTVRLKRCRFVTIVGHGGVGKTTVAVAAASRMAGSYRDGVCFVDTTPLADPGLLPGVLASALGLSIISDAVLEDLTGQLRHKQVLIVFDNCERIAEAVARATERILQGARDVHVLVTSREPLRAEGESVFRLPPLETPPISAGLSAAEALRFPSVQLFVERAASRIEGFTLLDADGPVAADICRQLDGIALAIELAAGRVDAYGMRGIAERLGDRFRLLRGGRRTALPRHQTLSATLDWSYDVLPDDEKALLRRLSVFVGGFTYDAVVALTGGAGVSAGDPVDGVANLVSRSLVTADVDRIPTRYRLLETTRAYAEVKLTESGEGPAIRRRHAGHYAQVFERALGDWEQRDPVGWLTDHVPDIDNLRAALDWAFSPQGDAALGTALTIAAIPLWFQLSATDECRNCVQRALSSLDSPGSYDTRARQIMQLYAALGLSRTFTIGLAPEAAAAWHKALEIAVQLGDREFQREAQWGLWLCQIGGGDYRAAYTTANAFSGLADALPDVHLGHRLVGVPLHCLGEHAIARVHIEQGLESTKPKGSNGVRFRFGQPMAARVILAQMLWLQGSPDQAMQAARRSVEESEATAHAISLCDALAQAMCPIALFIGDCDAAEHAIEWLLRHTHRHALGPWSVLGRCWKAVLLITRAEWGAGVPMLAEGLESLREVRFAFYRTQFMGVLASGMASAGEVSRGLTMIDEALSRCADMEELWCMSELLRVKGTILVLGGHGYLDAAEQYFRQSLDWARRQGSLSWELRTVVSLGRLQRLDGRRDEARRSIAMVYERFTEGFGTVDLRAAKQLVDELV